MELQKYLDYLVQWLQEQVKLANAKGLIVGVSGGIDSAVTVALIKKAMSDNHLAVFMPCYSSSNDEILVKKLLATLDLKLQIINLESAYNELQNNFNWHDGLSSLQQKALVNCKPRLRMTSLYALAQANEYLVVGTSNFDEWYTGYFTKHGDSACDILPLIHLLKSQINTAAKLLNIPQEIINQPPSAGLWAGQTDEKEMGITYAELDNFLNGQEKLLDNNIVTKIKMMHKNSEHKRKSAIIPKKFIFKI
ncbi:NAD(+) synthase [Spiroplasma endosymbiont of Eupeodes luniger]|uniref:NAD(+) synthase n=1 Tax=Spiroplasma endosymbiont of Eupeodes luniger TaxID=3066300 RepID=UPI0030D0F843